MKVLCLSCFGDADELALADVKNHIRCLNGSVFRRVENSAQLKLALADSTLLADLDMLILVAHAQEGGEKIRMRDDMRIPANVITSIGRS